MRIHAIKDSEVPVKKKLTIAAGLTAVVILIVLAYKRLEPNVLKYLKTRKRHRRITKRQAINKEFDYNKYIDEMVEIQENYEGQSSLWI